MTTDDERAFYREAGERLAVLCCYLGHSPESFAAMLGLKRRAYVAFERGERGCGWAELARVLSERTNVSLDWVFTGCLGVHHPAGRNDRRPLFRDGRAVAPALRVIGD